MQLKRRDFSSASATKNAVVRGAHFRLEDYHPRDRLEFNVGCRSKNQMPLTPGAVPSVPTASSGPLSAAAAGAAAGGRHGHGSGRDSARRKRELRTLSLVSNICFLLTQHNDLIHEKQCDLYRLLQRSAASFQLPS